MGKMYKNALKFIVQNELVPIFRDRLSGIVDDTEGMGWGFHDGLSDFYFCFTYN
jgi:hypothetical protein